MDKIKKDTSSVSFLYTFVIIVFDSRPMAISETEFHHFVSILSEQVEKHQLIGYHEAIDVI